MLSGPSTSLTTKTNGEEEFVALYEDWPWVWAIRDKSVLGEEKNSASTVALNEDRGKTTGRNYQAIIGHCISQQQPIERTVPMDCTVDWKRLNRELPVAVSETLYLGNALSVSHTDRLQELGIGSVLNLAGKKAFGKTTLRAFEATGILCHRIDAVDTPGYPLLKHHWKEAYAFLKEQTTPEENGTLRKCAVICVAGMNRSALICAAFYMMSNQKTVLEVVHHIRAVRGNVALSNEGFQEQLVALARRHNRLGPLPGTLASFVTEKAPDPPASGCSDSDWRVYLPFSSQL